MKLTNHLNQYKGLIWRREINVRDFIQNNYTPYTGDESFLVGPTARTLKLWDILSEMFKVEREKGVYDAETKKRIDYLKNFGFVKSSVFCDTTLPFLSVRVTKM